MYRSRSKAFGSTRAILALAIFVFYIAVIAAILFAFNHAYKKHQNTRVMYERPNFNAFDVVSEKKTAFFDYIGRIAESENQYLLKQRGVLKRIKEEFERKAKLKKRSAARLLDLCEHYDIELSLSVQEKLNELEKRINIIPVALVQAQAAIESGWGTSRFAVEGHNLFGQWCFAEGCGIIPANRAPGRSHEVAVFSSDSESIRAYMLNLNSFHVYTHFRDLRAGLDPLDLPSSGYALAAGLNKYSERGAVYVEEVRTMIRANNLEP